MQISREILKDNEYCFERKQEPRVVTTSKKNDIIHKLCPLMPENRRKFWNDLPCCGDSIDLADQRENGDYVYKKIRFVDTKNVCVQKIFTVILCYGLNIQLSVEIHQYVEPLNNFSKSNHLTIQPSNHPTIQPSNHPTI